MSMTLIGRIRQARSSISRSVLLMPRNQEERNARLLLCNTAMLGVPMGGIAAFMPVFLARLGASSTLVGWLTSAPGLIMVLFLIPGAMLSERSTDQVRVRTKYARLARMPFLLCALAPFVIPVEHLPLALVLIWAVKTIPEAVAMPAWTAVIARAISPARRAQLNGARWALLSVASAISSAVFGWMLDSMVFPLNYQVVFMISFAAAGLDPYFFSFIKIEPSERAALKPSRNVLSSFREYFQPVLQHRPFLVFLASTVLYRLALNAPAPLFSLFWVNELQATDTLIGLRGTVGHAALVVGYMFWGRSANRLGHRRVLTLCALGFAAYPIMTGLSPTAIWILPAAAVWGLTAAGLDIGLFDLMLASCPNQRQPLFAAVWSMVANTAIFVGPLLGAALSNSTSLGFALIIAGVAQVVTTIPFRYLPHDV
jgi:MFS family permease